MASLSDRLQGSGSAYCVLSGTPAYHTIGLEGGPVVCRRVMLPCAGGDRTAERLIIGLEPGPLAAPGVTPQNRRAGLWLN